MKKNLSAWGAKIGAWPLKIKLSLAVMIIFAVGVGALSVYVVKGLRSDFEDVISKEQTTTVSFVTHTIDRELDLRIGALRALAPEAALLLREDVSHLRAYINDKPVALQIFSRDIYVISPQGERVAEAPFRGMLGKKYTGVNYFEEVLATRQPVVKPEIDPISKQHLLVVAVPLFGPDGDVAGVLCGAELIDVGSFFHFSGEVRNGATGGFDIISPKDGVYAASTDAHRVLQPMPAKGVSPLFDRRLQGYLGSGTAIDSAGVENLRTAARSRVANWLVIAYIPTSEAFAPVQGVADRIYAGAILITVLGGLLIWLLLRRELAPVESASRLIGEAGSDMSILQPFVIEGSREIRTLLDNFNRLQLNVREKTETIRQERDQLTATYAELKLAEEALRLLNQDLENQVLTRSKKISDLYQVLKEVLDSLPFGVSVFDEASKMILHNELYATLMCYPPELFEGGPLLFEDMVRYNFKRGDYGDLSFEQTLARFAAINMSSETVYFERVVPSGLSLESSGRLISAGWTLFTFRDTTAQKLAEKTLEEALHVAQAATEAKSGFLAHMSHEIRTPMNAIIGLAYLLEKAGLPGDSHALVRKISIAGRSLLSIINDILDFSKIEAGRIELERVPFSLDTVLDNLATIMSVSVGSKDIELIITPPEVRLDRMMGDSLRLEQILINLLGNGIKFTDQGHVELNVSLVSESEHALTLRFAVRDTGIGIPAEKQSEIFEPFSQAESSTTRHFGGTGLGLTISRRLVALMGAEMLVWSEAGKGSEFSFSLCFDRAAEVRLSAPEMANLDILIADDNPIALEALRRTTVALGWNPQVVESGEAALEVVTNLGGRGHGKVIVLDWKMPGMDGLETARAIREATEADDLALIIVMVTAYSSEELLASADSKMADAVLTKPVTPSGLYNAVACAQRARFGIVEQQCGAEGRRLEGVRILVVDDTEINREVALRIFAGEGAHVVLANDGQQAVDWLLAHAGEVDIVLMDVQMPVLDGLGATRLIRAAPDLTDLPVIALTAGAFKVQEDAAMAAGMSGFLPKPFDVDLAIAMILKCCRRRGAITASRTAGSPAKALASPVAGDLPGLAVGRGLKTWKDEKVYRQFLRKFARDFGASLTQMVQAEPDVAAARAHELKGAAGNLALHELAAATGEVDQALRAGEPTAALYIRMQTAMNVALDSIRRYAPEPVVVKSEAAGGRQIDDRTPGASLSLSLLPLLKRLLDVFNTDDPGAIGPVLAELDRLLPSSQLTAIHDALENFDFRGGEAAILALAAELNISMEASR